MEQKRKRVKRVSRMLVEAEPRYVSIVNHPANLTPFKDIKMEQEINPAPLKAEEPANTSGDTVANVCKKEANFTEGGVVKEFVFGPSFKSEESVKEYMELNNWTGFTISKVEGGFVATSETQENLVDERIIAITDDVSVCVAKVQEPEVKEEPVDNKKLAEVTMKSETSEPTELTQKYEAMLAYGNTIDEALAAGTDAYPTPVGFSEMFETFYNVLYVIYSNPEVVDKDAYLKKACADFADILVKLNALTTALLGSTDLAKKEAGEQWLNAMKKEKGLKMAEQETKEVEAVKEEAPVEAAPTEATTEPAAETPAEAPAEQPNAAEEAPVAPAEPEAVTEAPSAEASNEEVKSEGTEIADLRSKMEEMQKTIDELMSKAQKAEESGADVEASPSKKSEIFETSGCASNENAEKELAVKAEKAKAFRSQLSGILGF